MTETVTGADLDWTIARIASPNDKLAKASVRASFLGRNRVGSAMTRTDIAASSSASSPTTPTCGQRPPSASEKR